MYLLALSRNGARRPVVDRRQSSLSIFAFGIRLAHTYGNHPLAAPNLELN